MDNVNADHEPNTATQRHEGRMHNQSWKLRLYPSSAQKRSLAQWFGHARWAWNTGLNMRSKAWSRRRENVTGVDIGKTLTAMKQRIPWLSNVPLSCLQQSLRDQDQAFVNFFEGRSRYPKFKSRFRKQSARVTIDARHVGKANAWRSGSMKLPQLGTVKLKGRKLPSAMPRMVTVSKDTTGRYWASFSVMKHVQTSPRPSHKCVGVDLGINCFAVLSTGERIENPRHLARDETSLKKLQKRLARQAKGSKRRTRTTRRIAKLHARIACRRLDFLHKVTTDLVRRFRVICVEALNVKGMMASATGTVENPGTNVRQKSGLNRSIADIAWGTFLRLLSYKATWHRRTVVEVDRWFASSKLCSACGEKNSKLTLSTRSWTCAHCNTKHDRDENAAVNIETKGLTDLGLPSARHAENPCSPARAKEMHASGEAVLGQTISCQRESLYAPA